MFLHNWPWHVTQHTQKALLCSHHKKVTRTRHNVTLYVHCFFPYIQNLHEFTCTEQKAPDTMRLTGSSRVWLRQYGPSVDLWPWPKVIPRPPPPSREPRWRELSPKRRRRQRRVPGDRSRAPCLEFAKKRIFLSDGGRRCDPPPHIGSDRSIYRWRECGGGSE